MNLEDLENDELISLYPKLLQELKRREIIRTNNLIGELGEFIAASEYKKILNYLNYNLILKVPKMLMPLALRVKDTPLNQHLEMALEFSPLCQMKMTAQFILSI